jgi:predicted aspartyl protease
MQTIWRWISTIAIIPLLLTLPQPATAQEDPGGCFMVTSSGRTLSLSKLCGGIVDVFRIPIKRHIAKTPVIDVLFNGTQTNEMILDTGASMTLIPQDLANILNVQPAGTLQVAIADGSEVEFKTGQIPTVAVGGILVNNVDVAIAPKMKIGLLGHNFFDNYDIKILEKEVEFHRR